MTEDIFREVDDDFRAERLRATAKRYAGLVVGALVVVAVVVGAWQYSQWHTRQLQERETNALLSVLEKLDASSPAGAPARGVNPAEQEAVAQLQGVVKKGHIKGVKALASLQQAALLAKGGKRDEALRIWESLSTANGVDPLLKGLAGLLWVQWQIDDGDISVLRSRLSLLASAGQPWRPMAQELMSALEIRAGNQARAQEILKELSHDAEASEGIRQRAQGLLQTFDNTKAESRPAPGEAK